MIHEILTPRELRDIALGKSYVARAEFEAAIFELWGWGCVVVGEDELGAGDGEGFG